MLYKQLETHIKKDFQEFVDNLQTPYLSLTKQQKHEANTVIVVEFISAFDTKYGYGLVQFFDHYKIGDFIR